MAADSHSLHRRQELLALYTEACNYPGRLDEAAVEKHLAAYLKALGVTRKIERLRSGWSVYEHPELLKYVGEVLDDFAKRTGSLQDALAAQAAQDAQAARAALDARDAQDALAALDARDARDAQAARAALDARAALAALAALDARDARDAQAARDAQDALAALAALAARDARDAQDALAALAAQAARDARDAQDALALQRFTSWCIQAGGSWWWRWWVCEVSFLASTYLGSVQLRRPDVERWSAPLFSAFLDGAWLLHWTADTLFWVAKPTVHVEKVPSGRRLHNASYAALESDIENLYFWHGVIVPAFVVVKPEWITVQHVLSEPNAEVKRVMVERMGMEKFLTDSGAKQIHAHEMGDLFSIELPGDPEQVLRAVRVTCPSTGRKYFLRVPPQISRADDAVAWTFGFEVAKDYRPLVET